MADSVEFVLDLDQNVDTESKKAARGLKKFERTAESAGRGAKGAGKKISTVESGLAKLRAGFAAIRGPALVAVAAFVAVGAAVGVLAVKVGQAALKGEDFARTTRGMFEKFSGSAAVGEEALKDIRDIAFDTAAPLQELRQTYGTLFAAGLRGQMLKDMTTIRFDMMAMGEEGESAFGKITDAMVEGEVTASQFEDMVKGAAFDRKELGLALGISEAALNMEKGAESAALLGEALKKLSPEAFLKIVRDLHKARAGMGKTAKAAASFDQRLASLSELAGLEIGMRLKSPFVGLLEDAETFMRSEAGQDLFADVSKGMQVVMNLGKSLFSGFGAEITKHGPAIKEIFGDIAKDLASPETQEAMKAWGKNIARSVGWAVRIGGVIFGLVVPAFRLFSAVLDTIGTIVEPFVAAIATIIGWLVALTDSFMSTFAIIFAFLASLADDFVQAGIDLMQGLADGVTAGANAAVAAVKGAAGQVLAVMKSAFKLGSPSKVFADIGGNVTAGFAGGIDAGSSTMQAATASTFEPEALIPPAAAGPSPDLFGAQGAAQAANDGGGGGGGVGSPSVTIMVTVEGGGEEQGENIGQAVRREIDVWWEGVALAAGV